MGCLKQLLPYRGTTLLGHVVQQVQQAALDPVVVVVGAGAEAVADTLPHTVQIVHNERWPQGLGTSLACGISHLQGAYPNVAAALLILADQPYAEAPLLRRLVDTYRHHPCDAVALQYPSGPGVPALVSAPLLDVLRRSEGDRGARAVLRHPGFRITIITQPEVTQDVDTPEEYRRIIARTVEQ